MNSARAGGQRAVQARERALAGDDRAAFAAACLDFGGGGELREGHPAGAVDPEHRASPDRRRG